MKPNSDVRTLARDNSVFLWEIGKRIGKSEQTIVKWLRDEPLPISRKTLLVTAINEIAAEKRKESIHD